MSSLPVGLLQATTAAIGQSLNELAGLRITRLTSAAAAGDTQLLLERTAGLPVPGKVAVDGVPYTYTGVNGSALTGIAFTHGGVPVAGTAAAHAIGAEVIDLSGTYSAIDQVNRALFVDTAEGGDLSALGRNLNVLRAPSLQDDAQYRALIKALAYNPRGTLLGLRLVLDTLIGVGNYTLYEDLERYPCQVFVTVPGALFLNAVAQGKAYSEQTLTAVAANNAITTPVAALFASSVQPVSENVYANTRAQLPPSTVWAQTGGQGLSIQPALINQTDTATDFLAYGGYLHHAGAVLPNTYARLQCTVGFSNDGSLSFSDGRRFCGCLADGTKGVAWGVTGDGETQVAQLGLIAVDTGRWITGTVAQLDLGQFYAIELRKYGTGNTVLLLDGAVVQTAAYADAGPSQLFGATLGSLAPEPTPHAQITNLGFAARNTTDALNLQATSTFTGSISAGTSKQLALSQNVLLATDTGKTLRIRGSTAKNSLGGNNNGTYALNYVDGGHATLTLGSGTAQVTSAYPQRITFSQANLLAYPDALGMQVQIGPSAQGNGGLYTISRLLDPTRLTDFAAYPVSKTRYTNVCEVQSASFVPEQAVPYTLQPTFTAEQNVRFELIDAANHVTNADGTLSVQPRGPTALLPVPYAVRAANVKTAQVYSSHTPFVTFDADGVASHAPFYVSDAVFFVETYLSGVVAAGVRLNFSFS